VFKGYQSTHLEEPVQLVLRSAVNRLPNVDARTFAARGPALCNLFPVADNCNQVPGKIAARPEGRFKRCSSASFTEMNRPLLEGTNMTARLGVAEDAFRCFLKAISILVEIGILVSASVGKLNRHDSHHDTVYTLLRP
jgi:hypothetical protein